LTRFWKTPGTPWVAGLAIAAACLAWAAQSLLAPSWLNDLEERSGDVIWRINAKHKDERRLIIVDIDERSLREIGPWPWPRPAQARLIESIAALGASLQIYDIVFTDPRPDDAALAAAIRKHDPVLAQVFALQQGGESSVGEPGGALRWAACPAPFGEARGYLANASALRSNFVGHITPRLDADGLVRHVPAIVCHKGQSYPALALAALLRATGERQLALQKGESLLDAPWTLTGKSLPAGPIPLDNRGDMRVPWRLHPQSFVSLSASDVLAGRVPQGLLENSWVLVGSTAFGLNDTIATPFGAAGAGLQVHAQIMSGLIDGRSPYAPIFAPWYQALAALVGVVLLVLLGREGRRFPVYLLPLAALAWCGVLWLVHAASLETSSLWLGWTQPAFFVFVAGTAMGILQHAKSRIDRDRLFTHLSSYLPAPVAAALVSQSPSSAIKASTNQVSVMFADIRNFSAYCEARPPEEAAAVLHAFFSTATRIVEAEGGVIEAFQGDAILAVWNGSPAQDSAAAGATHHALRALQAAINLSAAVQGVLPDPAPAGLEPLALGIGVETGPAMAGSFGLASRRTHMVLGRTVTIASRLVEMTADLAHPILVGEGLAAHVGAAGLESLGTFLLDGMRVPHHVYAYPLVPSAKLA
jgi:adenylate cyclase